MALIQSAVPVIDGVMRSALTAAAQFTVSHSGTLAYLPQTNQNLQSILVWVDRGGLERPAAEEPREYAAPRLSPDGTEVAFSQGFGGAPDSVWIYNFDNKSFKRLTFEGTIAGTAAWSADGHWLAFQSNRDGSRNLYRRPVDGSGPVERLTTSSDTQMITSWSRDGHAIAFHGGGDISVVPIGEEPRALVASTHTECCAVFSPDTGWIAYVSNEEGRDNVYVRPYPDPNPDLKWLVSGTEGGQEPVWSPDGSELFYRSGDKMMVVPVKTQPNFTAGRPTVLFENSYLGSNSVPQGYQYYDIAPDGQRFLMIKSVEQERIQINIIFNWFEELNRLVPAN